MFNADRAIQDKKEDLLGRAPFSEQLGKYIYEYKGNDSLVTAIYGKWGTGKTSIANMVLQEIQNLSKSNETIIIRFEPWNYSDKDNLIQHFFNSLEEAISSSKLAELMKDVREILKKYSKCFELIPHENPWYKVIWSFIINVLNGNSTLHSCKDSLKKALIDVNKKIVVLIDDIDRLTNSQIRSIIQIVKMIGDLPKITYILAMDRAVVVQALEDGSCPDGNEYLEKIVQIPLQIPTLSQTKLHEIFDKSIYRSIQSISADIDISDNYHCYKVLEKCVYPYLRTIRDINRFLNIFNFKYSSFCKEIPLEEIIGITAIEVLNPKLFEWIAKNINVLWAETDKTSNQNTVRSSFYEQFQSLGVDPDLAIESVATLFPSFAKNIGTSIFQATTFSKKMKKFQFELIMGFAVDTIEVPMLVINDLINSSSDYDFRIKIEQINDNGNLEYVAKQIESYINKIPIDRLKLLISVLINLPKKPKKDFLFTSIDIVYDFAHKLVQKLPTKEDRYSLYNDLLRKDYKSLGFVASALLSERNSLTDSDLLSNLELLFIQQINAVQNKEDLINIYLFTSAFKLWYKLNKVEAENYFNTVITQNYVQKLKFVCRYTSRGYVNNKEVWVFNSNGYGECNITDEAIFDDIKKLDNKTIKNFTEEEQIKLATFVLGYMNNDKRGDVAAVEYVNTKWGYSGFSANDSPQY